MDKGYKLIISFSAKKDMQNIFKYIAEDSVYYANETINKMDKAFHELLDFPLMHSLSKNKSFADKGYRIIQIGNYIAVYVVKEKTIQILRVFHGKRDYQFLL